MTVINVIKGDVTQASENIIVHQVNTLNKMGAGVAKALYTKYPMVKSQYHTTTKQLLDIEGGRNSELLGFVDLVTVGADKIIANLYGQIAIAKSRTDKHVYTSYQALTEGFESLAEYAQKNNYTIAMPYGIGCGLANGDWNKVTEIIESVFSKYNQQVTLYQL